MTETENISQVEALGIDRMGFIFYPKSKRFVGEPPAYLPRKAMRVGVFVNASAAEIRRRIEQFGLNSVQLHGLESPAFCAEIRSMGVEVIKAIHVTRPDDLAGLDVYPTDYLLFEAPTPDHGGSGQHFDWSLLNLYCGQTPFILSGGIGPGDAEAINAMTHPMFAGIDLNSRFESAPGIKNPEALATFLNQLHQ